MPSYLQGASEPPLLDLTIGEALVQAAGQWPERPALVDVASAVRLDWATLQQRADALALGLLSLGLNRGDRIGIWSFNCAEWVILQFATARAGMVLVTINPAYKRAELAHALLVSGCAALFIAPAFKSSDYAAVLGDLVPEAERITAPWSATRFPDLRCVIQIGPLSLSGAIGFDALEELGQREPDAVGLPAAGSICCDDPVNIQFTSGTTGSPKGVTLSHRNILNNGYFVGRALALSERDRLCIPVPLYHCFGMVMGNLACLTHGAAMILVGAGFDAARTLEVVDAEQCTALYGVPTMFVDMLSRLAGGPFDLSSLRTGIMAGSPCPIEVMRSVRDRMHMTDLTICYGMTETSPVSFQSAPSDTLERRVTTVGRVHPHVEVKIIGADGETVETGEIGELCTRGYSVMLGYWDDPEQTAAVRDAEGWMHSGDLATIDPEGFCTIVGRLKDMVIRGGENLYAREVEEFLHTHPGIREAQVFGVPDDRFGEELCAWIIPHSNVQLDATEVRAFCAGQISHQKVPRYIRIVDVYPLTVTGKVQKFVMREQMIEQLQRNRGATKIN
jgi:fatty-acyl-CoA synthase